MTAAQRELLQRVAHGEPLHWVHPATPTGSALFGDAFRRPIPDRTVHACIRHGWLKVAISTAYFQPVHLTDAGQRALALAFPACTSDTVTREMLQEP